MASSSTCPSCGARVPADADRCDLCGAPVDDEAPSEAPDDPGDATSGDATSGASNAAADSSSEAASQDEPASAESSGARSSGAESGDAASSEGVFCTQCGWQNPSGANFCSRCGTKLQDVSAAPDTEAPDGTRRVAADLPSGSAPDDASSPAETDDGDAAEEDAEQQTMGQRITMLVGVAVLAVVAIFFVSLWSQGQDWGSRSSGEETAQTSPSEQAPGGAASRSGGGAGGPSFRSGSPSSTVNLDTLAAQTASDMPPALAQEADSLQSVLAGASGVQARAAQRQLVNLYIGAGQTGRAAVVQQELAEADGSVDMWRRTGDLFYRWMQQLQQQGQRREAFTVAQQAAQAYESVVAEQPDNLEARTRMGEAYLLTNNPMRGIETINQVLADDSTFVPARFQKGLALLQISRFDQAIEEFETVKRYAEDGSAYYRNAERAIGIIREQSSGPSSGASSGASGASGGPAGVSGGG